MRIGIFTDSYKPSISGVVTSINMLREGLETLGHDVYIIAPSNKLVKEETDPKVFRLLGIPFPFKSLREYRIVFYTSRLMRKLKDLNLDVIHIHTEFTIGQIGLRMQKKYNIPLVYTMHTLYEDYLHHVSPFLVKHFKNEAIQIVRNEAKIIVERAEATFVPSNKIKNLLEKKIGVHGNLFVVPTGLDLEPFNKNNFSEEQISDLKNKLGISKDDFVLLTIGRVSPEKDLVFLLDGFKEYLKSDPDSKFLIVGGGVYLEELIEEVKIRNLENNVILTGFVEWKDIALYYNLGDCFVNASVTETQGLTFIEALASSKIVVARHDEAVEDIIVNGKNGFLYNNTFEFVESIKRIKNDINLRNKMQAEALKSIKKYSKEEYARKASEIYEKIVTRKQSQ